MRLEVGVEAAGPIGDVEAAVGRVNESARLEELATLGNGVIDIPAGVVGGYGTRLSQGGLVAPPRAPKSGI